MLDGQRLRRLAEDRAATPAERLRAWRRLETSLASASRDGGSIAAGPGLALVAAGIDRVHLDAFLAGLPPRAIIAADPGPGPGPGPEPGGGGGDGAGGLTGSMTPRIGEGPDLRAPGSR